MSNRPIDVDVATLVQPISDLLPSGESLRRGTVYDKIKEARREDDPGLAQGVWKTDVKRADWREVAKIALEALQNKSKDLRIAAWLTEAWLSEYGFAGAERGLRVIEGLCDRFWDSVYPQVDDEDLDSRMAPISWINEKLSVSLKLVPITAPNTKEPDILNWQDWEKASMLERAGQKPGEGDVSTPQFQTAVLLTPASFYRRISQEIHELKTAAADLEKLIDKKVGQPMAALWQFKEILDSMAAFVGQALDQKAEEEPGGEEDAEGGATPAHGAPQDDPGGKGVRWGPIRNRAEAYQRLSEAADYLLQKEPHSPVPHLIRRAVSWGNMTFAELIQELVSEQHNLGAIYQLLGMKAPD
ncbi:MAG: type VI secretion system protein TssA [Myxococcales bacterium]|nr:type VI secretion system protein TssA [Myxococcales bacterium]